MKSLGCCEINFQFYTDSPVFFFFSLKMPNKLPDLLLSLLCLVTAQNRRQRIFEKSLQIFLNTSVYPLDISVFYSIIPFLVFGGAVGKQRVFSGPLHPQMKGCLGIRVRRRSLSDQLYKIIGTLYNSPMFDVRFF